MNITCAINKQMAHLSHTQLPNRSKITQAGNFISEWNRNESDIINLVIKPRTYANNIFMSSLVIYLNCASNKHARKK